ncbi:hypothetical protein FY034_07310 [Trichlorobacter lovleyi]|uniref:hypothetical protein n=1 Tax=Trichlorobacter lovleyi TaxID=313985 RepID=UPI00223E9FB4|nr:hypothetical protein [Trichlorobacter lovleyi]QOX78744.1 hypothetical protein FY034_07310 [Trichlorobacter lovleyi]
MTATNHATDLQAILDAAIATAKANPTAANISTVEKARKAVDDYNSAQAGDPAGEKFKTQTAALLYLQRTYKIEKSKLSADVQAGKVPRKDGVYSAKDLDYYANAVRLELKNSEPQQNSEDGGEQLKRFQAQLAELKLQERRGQLIDAAEEEARDAKLWFAVWSDIENQGPNVINQIINRIGDLGLPEEIHQRITALVPELRQEYEDTLADIRDRYARDGGIEA